MLVLWIVPNYAFKVDPEPTIVPAINEVYTSNLVINKTSHKVNQREEFYNYIQNDNPAVKQVANSVSAAGCNGNTVCNAKALFYFTQRNINYVSQIKLKKTSTSIKNELDKIKSMNIDDIDLKKQVVVCKTMPDTVKRSAWEKVEEMKS